MPQPVSTWPPARMEPPAWMPLTTLMSYSACTSCPARMPCSHFRMPPLTTASPARMGPATFRSPPVRMSQPARNCPPTVRRLPTWTPQVVWISPPAWTSPSQTMLPRASMPSPACTSVPARMPAPQTILRPARSTPSTVIPRRTVTVPANTRAGASSVSRFSTWSVGPNWSISHMASSMRPASTSASSTGWYSPWPLWSRRNHRYPAVQGFLALTKFLVSCITLSDRTRHGAPRRLEAGPARASARDARERAGPPRGAMRRRGRCGGEMACLSAQPGLARA
ncbi:Uncharacterised protein [Bordetella pertussis]|nr:Uncharacterised protein [Bordetella pertussis]CPL73139.1 Uncharacterised protein [Bordetella pertussis]